MVLVAGAIVAPWGLLVGLILWLVPAIAEASRLPQARSAPTSGAAGSFDRIRAGCRPTVAEAAMEKRRLPDARVLFALALALWGLIGVSLLTIFS